MKLNDIRDNKDASKIEKELVEVLVLELVKLQVKVIKGKKQDQV